MRINEGRPASVTLDGRELPKARIEPLDLFHDSHPRRVCHSETTDGLSGRIAEAYARSSLTGGWLSFWGGIRPSGVRSRFSAGVGMPGGVG